MAHISRISRQAVPRPAWVPVLRASRDEARTGASGSIPSQLSSLLRLLLSILTSSPIPSLVSSCLADISGCLGTAPSSGGAWSSIPTKPERGVRGRGGRGEGCESPPVQLGQRCKFGCAGAGDSGLLC